jgi:ABC-type uncharacterized transport system substrate-binding protein
LGQRIFERVFLCDGRYTSRIQKLLSSRLTGVILGVGKARDAAGIRSTSIWDCCLVAVRRVRAPGDAATHRGTWCRRDGLESVDGCFCPRLRELGWIEGDTIDIDYRWAGGSSKRVSDFATELLRRHVDVIVTYGSAAAVLEQVTTTIPIVLAVAFDPVSLAQPGGNVTGISIQQPELIGKRLEQLHEVVPQLRRVAIMANAGYAAPVLEAEKTKATAQALGLEAARLQIWRSEDIAPAFEAIRDKADALYVVSDALIQMHS